MQRFIARENIDHYLHILNSDALLSPEKRETIVKLLIVEEDKLSHDLEQLEFAEDRTAKSRDRVNHVRKLRDASAEGSTHRAQTNRLLANTEAIHQLMERFCHQIRERVNSHGI